MKPFLNVMKTIQLLWKIVPGRVAGEIFARCFSFAYGAYYTLLFFRYLLNALENGADFSKVVLFFLGFTAFGLANEIMQAFLQAKYRPLTDEKIRADLLEKLCDKTGNGGIAPYESSKSLDERAKAADTAREKAIETLRDVAEACAALLGLCLNLGFALAVEPLVLPLALPPLFLSLNGQKRKSRESFAIKEESAPLRRRADYAKRAFYLKEYAKELRQSRIGESLQALFARAQQDQEKVAGNHGARAALFRFLAESGVQCLLYGGLYAFIVWRYLAHDAFSLGDFSSMSGAVLNLIHFTQLLLSLYAALREKGLYAKSLHHVLEAKDNLTSGELSCHFEREIEFRNVSFSYGGEPVLQNLSFTIKKGERIALTGLNGSGKSTLIKLLLRLYDPQEGEILLDGRDIRDYTLSNYRASFACVFQDFQLYALPVLDNVALGVQMPPERIGEALRKVGLKMAPSDELTREFEENGLELSGGQAQRLAAARVFASPAPIAVLDEPSSALDPLGERDLYETLLRASENRTLLLVSHRLSSVRDVDRVLHMEDGRMMEQGSHEELLRLGGAYARLYNQQAEGYKKGGFSV